MDPRQIEYCQSKTKSNGEVIENSSQYDIISKEIAKSELKELNDRVRIVIRRRIVKEGAAKTFQDIFKIPDGHTHLAILEEYDRGTEEETWGQLSGQDTLALWCTLSPEPDTCTTDQLMETMEKISKKKGVKAMAWNIEREGKDKPHLHTHFLVWLDKTVQQGERARMRTTIEYACKMYKTKSNVFLQIKACSQKNAQNKVNYIMGKKTDPGKHRQVAADKEWRKTIGLDDYYFVEN